MKLNLPKEWYEKMIDNEDSLEEEVMQWLEEVRENAPTQET